MKFPYVSCNGQLIPVESAILHLDSTEVMYGFGVYETVKVRNNIVYFLPQHIDRLMYSARQIDLMHHFSSDFIEQSLHDLLAHLKEQACNIKLLLYGASYKDKAQLFILPSAPLFPDRKWYREGVSLISFEHERWMPQAKTLNMLPSYYMYSKAKERGCYDALLYDKEGNLREGTRTNAYVIKGKHIVSPPKKDILEGVTMMTLQKVLEKSEYSLEYRNIPMSSIWEYDGLFLTSTSTKIMPVRYIDDKSFPFIAETIAELIRVYEVALDQSQGDFNRL